MATALRASFSSKAVGYFDLGYDEDTRANTLHRVLAALPESGPIVLAVSMTAAIAKRARRAQQAGAPAPVSRAMAVVYMLVWCSIIVAGRMIAYY